MGKQFASYYGSDVRDISAWQALCIALQVDPVPDTITQCKRVCICLSTAPSERESLSRKSPRL